MNVKIKNILEHMFEDASDIALFTQKLKNAVELSENRLYRKAIVMSILNIGELVKNLPDNFKQLHNNIPWKKIMAMRNIAAHGYHVMDDDIIWDVATQSIPELLRFLETQLNPS